MAKKPSTRKTKPTKTKIAVQLLLWVGLPTGMLGLSALLLNQWRTDTHIKLELTAKSMQLVTAEQSPSTSLLSETLKFDKLDIDGMKLTECWPRTTKTTENTDFAAFPEASLKLFGGSLPRSRLSVDSPGVLPDLDIKAGAALTLAADKHLLHIKWPQSPQKLEVLPDQPVHLRATNIRRQDDPQAPLQTNLSLIMTLDNLKKFLKTATLPGGGLTVVLPENAQPALLNEAELALSRIGFAEQNKQGDAVSTLTGPVKLSYPDYPKLAEQSLEDSKKLLTLKPADNGSLKLTALTLDAQQGLFKAKLVGTVQQFKLGDTDQRLTWLEVLKNNELGTLIFAILAWACPVCYGIYKLINGVDKA